MPGIMTGTIIGMAHALGETAPLLMIGMIAFIVDVPKGFTEAATVLPVQIYLWSDLPELGLPGQDRGRHHRAAGLPVRHERHGDLAAQEVRAPLVNVTEKGIIMDMAVQRGFHGRHALRRGVQAPEPRSSARDVNVYYGEKHALKDVYVDIPEKGVMAFIGPSGCGKSTFLRCINRMNDTIPICRVTGKIEIDGRTSTIRPSTSCSCARASAWCSRSPTRSPSRSSRTSPTGRASMASQHRKADLEEIVVSSLRARRACSRR